MVELTFQDTQDCVSESVRERDPLKLIFIDYKKIGLSAMFSALHLRGIVVVVGSSLSSLDRLSHRWIVSLVVGSSLSSLDFTRFLSPLLFFCHPFLYFCNFSFLNFFIYFFIDCLIPFFRFYRSYFSN